MIESNISKLNLLERELPEGLVVDGAWLEKLGIASNLRSYYVRAGWLEQPVRGVYRKTRGQLQWQQVVISLQTLLGLPLHVGGRTALELQGFAHYLSFHNPVINLYGPEKPPGWLHKPELPQIFRYHNSHTLFPATPVRPTSLNHAASVGLPDDDLMPLSWGQWDWSLMVSSPERAFLEMLNEVPHRETFSQADLLMQGASNLSPRRLQRLLVTCASVKAKRLFFFFADRHQHPWRKRLTAEDFDLGTGKRMLVPGGRLDPVYLITVPDPLDAFS